MKFFIIFAAVLAVAIAQSFDVKDDVASRIKDSNDRIKAARLSSLDYVNKQQTNVLNMIKQVSDQMKSTNDRLRRSIQEFIDDLRSSNSFKAKGDRLNAAYSPFLANTAKAIDQIRTVSFPIAVKKTPEAIKEDLLNQVENITNVAYAEVDKYKVNVDFYNCRYMYHTQLIADYFLFAAKNDAYCVDFLNYQIFGDAAEILQLIFHNYDIHMDLLEEAVRASNMEPILAVSYD